MSEEFKQTLIDINNISYHLSIEEAKRIEKIAEKLLDVKLLEVMPKLQIKELDDLDVTEKIMLLREYSLSDEQRKKELDASIPLEEILKEEGLQ